MSMFGDVGAWARSLFRRSPAEESPVNVVATVPNWMVGQPRQTQVSMRELMDQGFRRNVIINACITEIASSAGEPALEVYDTRTGEVLDPVKSGIGLFDQPSPHQSRQTFMEQSLVYHMAAGVAYIHIGRARSGMPIQLRNLRPDWMAPIPAADGSIQAYRYTPEGMGPVLVPGADVVRIPIPDPLNEYGGLSPITVCAAFGDIDHEAAIFLRDFFMNGAMPLGLLKLKTQTKKDVRERVRDEWSELYGRGSVNPDTSGRRWHRLAVLGADVEYQALGTTLDHLRMDGIWSIVESRICAAHGVPPIVIQCKLGLDKSTFANYAEARKSLWQETLPPIYGRYDQAFSRVAREFDPRLGVRFRLSDVAAMREDQDKVATRATVLFSGGIISRSRAREMAGEPAELALDGTPVPDVVIVPQGAKDAESIIAPPPPPVPVLPALPAPPPDEEDEPEEEPDDDPEDDEAMRDARVSGVAAPKASPLATAWRRFASTLADGLDDGALEVAIQSQDAEAALEALPWDAALEAYGEAYEAHLLATADGTGERTADAVVASMERTSTHPAAEILSARYRTKDKRVLRWVKNRATAELARLSKDSRQAIKESILRTLRGEQTFAQAKRDVLANVGLSRVQAHALRAYEERLRKNPDRAPGQVDRMVARKAGQMLRQRADRIARHETSEAATYGQRLAWEQLREQGVIGPTSEKEWEVTTEAERTCPTCYDLDGVRVGLDDAFPGGYDGPPEPHLGCECKLNLIPRADAPSARNGE